MNKFSTLNIFDDGATVTETIRRQRISTRVYLVIFSISISAITMHTMLLTRTEIQSFSNPSEADYHRLLASYSQSLKCSCKKISIEQKHFLEMNTTFHSICSSDLVGMEWRDFLFGDSFWGQYDRRDIRVHGSIYFSFLASFCDIAQRTVADAIDQFLNETFLSAYLISKSEFDVQVGDVTMQFQKNTLAKFAQSLLLLRGIINGNAFVSAYELNWFWNRGVGSNIDRLLAHPIRRSSGCSCATRSDCVDPGGIHAGRDGAQIFPIAGWNVGCSVVETLLRSTLECFYSQTCMQSMMNYIRIGSSEFQQHINVSIPHASNASRFKTNTIIQEIVDQLFIEEWHIGAFYSSFYHQCAPSDCSYQIVRDDHLMYTISKVLGLYGGLTVALRFSIPLLVKALFRIRYRCRTNTITPARSAT